MYGVTLTRRASPGAFEACRREPHRMCLRPSTAGSGASESRAIRVSGGSAAAGRHPVAESKSHIRNTGMISSRNVAQGLTPVGHRKNPRHETVVRHQGRIRDGIRQALQPLAEPLVNPAERDQ